MRRLIIMRHSKSEQEGETDHARRLSKRGVRDAAAAGRVLAARGDVPELALVSTAQRTRDTWESLCAGLGAAPEAWFDRWLYSSSTEAILELLGTVGESVQSVLIVGHNPTVSVLAHTVDDGTGIDLDGDLPTSGLASFDVPGAWDEVGAATLKLTHVDVPRG